MKFSTVEKGLFYAVTASGFLRYAFFTFNVGSFTLFPFRILFPLLCFVFLVRVLISGRISFPIKVRWYLGYLFFWLFYAFLTGVWAASKEDFLRHIGYLFLAHSYVFFCVYYLRSIRDLDGYHYLWLLAVFALTCIGVWEHITGDHLPTSRYETEARFSRYPRFIPTTVYMNPNDYATFITLSFPFLLSFLRYHKGLLQTVFATALTLTNVYLLLLTGSRANFLGVIIVIWSFLLLTSFREKLRIASAAVGVSASLFFLSAERVRQVWLGGIDDLMSLLPSGSDVSAAGRMTLLKDGLRFVLETIGFGVGAGNAEYWVASHGSGHTGLRGVVILNLHNWWLEILVNYGVFVFVGFMLFYLMLIWNLFKYIKTSNEVVERKVGETLLTSLLGFSVACVSSSSLMGKNFHWFIFAYAIAFLNYQRTKEFPRK